MRAVGEPTHLDLLHTHYPLDHYQYIYVLIYQYILILIMIIMITLINDHLDNLDHHLGVEHKDGRAEGDLGHRRLDLAHPGTMERSS